MALYQSALLDLLDVMRSADGGDLMRRLLATILQLLVDAEAAAFIGAQRHERSVARTNQRNGTRDKLVSTATGDLTIKDSEGPDGVVLPVVADPAAPGRCGVACGDHAGLGRGGVDPQGR